jgi:competence protein ComEA
VDADRPDSPSPRPGILPDDWLSVPDTPRPGPLATLAASTAEVAARAVRAPGLLAAAGLLLAGVVLIGAALLRQGGPSSSSIGAPGASAASSGSPVTVATIAPGANPAGPSSGVDPAGVPGTWIVDIAGAVARPGLYRLPAGSRVGDAVSAAGGFSPDVDATLVAASINLAAPLSDGEKVLVPSRKMAGASGGGEPAGSAAPGPRGSGLIDLNRATQAELDTLPGIGPVTAGKIIESRAASRFRSVDELTGRGLVKASVFEKVRLLVTVGG